MVCSQKKIILLYQWQEKPVALTLQFCNFWLWFKTPQSLQVFIQTNRKGLHQGLFVFNAPTHTYSPCGCGFCVSIWLKTHFKISKQSYCIFANSGQCVSDLTSLFLAACFDGWAEGEGKGLTGLPDNQTLGQLFICSEKLLLFKWGCKNVVPRGTDVMWWRKETSSWLSTEWFSLCLTLILFLLSSHPAAPPLDNCSMVNCLSVLSTPTTTTIHHTHTGKSVSNYFWH